MNDQLQAALAGEYAAIYAYGRGGARLGDRDKQTALDNMAAHVRRRDQLRAWLVDDGEQPAAPAPAYTLPGPVTGPGSAKRLLADVELRLIPLYTDLVGASGDMPARLRWAIRAVRTCGLRAQFWGAPGQAFPWPQDLQPPA